jgi:endonuclease-8
MPEGDTIFRTATVLRRALEGTVLRRFEAPRLRPRPFPPGTVIGSVEARGKHLLIAFDDGRLLHTHMGMSGSWHVARPGAPIPRRHQVRALVEVDGAVAVCLRAPVVELLRGRDLARHPQLSSLGPDLCSADVDLAEVLARLDRVPAPTPVGVALLDQRIACGIGNVYKSEILHALRIDPFAPVGDLDASSRRRLYATASELLRRNLDGGPRVTAGGGFAVYGKPRRPCPRCGTPIASRRQGEGARTTYWCPSCQSSAPVATA